MACMVESDKSTFKDEQLTFKFKLQITLLKYTDKYILKTSKTAFFPKKFWNSDFSQSWTCIYI